MFVRLSKGIEDPLTRTRETDIEIIGKARNRDYESLSSGSGFTRAEAIIYSVAAARVPLKPH